MLEFLKLRSCYLLGDSKSTSLLVLLGPSVSWCYGFPDLVFEAPFCAVPDCFVRFSRHECHASEYDIESLAEGEGGITTRPLENDMHFYNYLDFYDSL